MAKKSTAMNILGWVTPGRAIGRAVESVVRTKESIKSTAKEMGERLPGQQAPGAFEEGDVRNIADSKERYRVMYEMHGWTPADIARQIKVTRTTKFTAFLMVVLSMVGIVALAAAAPKWLVLILVPVSGCALILGVAQTFKYALYETQMQLEELISAREFVSREDFFKRLVG